MSLNTGQKSAIIQLHTLPFIFIHGPHPRLSLERILVEIRLIQLPFVLDAEGGNFVQSLDFHEPYSKTRQWTILYTAPVACGRTLLILTEILSLLNQPVSTH